MSSRGDDSGRGQGGETRLRFKGAHVVQASILTCVRWSLAYPVSDCPREALMQERGGSVDDATSHRPGVPATLSGDGGEAHGAAIRRGQAEHGTAMIVRQVQEQHQIIAPAHRRGQRVHPSQAWRQSI